jgi:DNA invertase Pin-like site-specific DNA recombinase
MSGPDHSVDASVAYAIILFRQGLTSGPHGWRRRGSELFARDRVLQVPDQHDQSSWPPDLDSTGIFKEAVIGILAAVARQERVRLSERTIAGLQRARAQGRVGGRPRTEHDPRTMARLASLRRSGASIRQIARDLDLSPTTVARLVRYQAVLG